MPNRTQRNFSLEMQADRRQWLKASLGLGLAGLTANTIPAARGLRAENPCQPHCGMSEYWIADATACPDTCDLEGNLSRLRFRRASGRRPWEEMSWSSFADHVTPDVPTTFYVHGYNAKKIGAWFDSHALGNAARHGPPFRMISWVWPADHRLFFGLRANLLQKIDRSDRQGYYLARVIDSLHPATHLTIAGHSFGARLTCSALQGLATGQTAGWGLPQNPLADRRPLQIALIAGAVESYELLPGGKYGAALSQADRTLITINRCDRTLNTMTRILGEQRILGLIGLPISPALGDIPDRIWQIDLQSEVGRRHWLMFYLATPEGRAALQAFTVYPDVYGDAIPDGHLSLRDRAS